VAEVSALGRKLGVTLPLAYVHALVKYPFPVDSDLAEVVFWPNPRRIIKKNKFYRDGGFFGQPWPKHYLIIGSMGNGDIIFLDTIQESPRVQFANHELTSMENKLVIEECHGSLELPEWLKVVFEGWHWFRKSKYGRQR
jgi:hypothetical protein